MHANTMNLFGISFILVSCLSSLCVQPALANWPVFSIEKGGTAVVPCVPKGDETAYFWSKGEDFATSQSVASRVLGIPSSDSEKYLVNEDGSLVIYNVTLAEGGRYHCRIVSENTNCRGAVSIEVTVNDFKFGIEQCEPRESCTLQVEASKETKLTCMAKDGPSSLSLKWFNGSEEINSVSNEHPLNEESSTISETITVPNEFGLPLTCEAVYSKHDQTCGRFAHIRLNKTDTAKQQTVAVKSSARWIVPLVLLTVVIVTLLIYIYERRKTYKGKRKILSDRADGTETLLGEKTDEFQGKLTVKDNALKECEKKLESTQTKLKQATDSSQECQKKLESTQAKLKQATDSSQKTTEDSQQKLTEKDNALKECEKKLESTQTKLKQATDSSQLKTEELEGNLNEKDKALKKCENKLESTQTKLTQATDSLQQKTEEFEGKLIEKDKALKKCEKKFESTQTKLKQATDSLQQKTEEFEGKMNEKDNALKECEKKLESTQTKLKQATDSLQDDAE